MHANDARTGLAIFTGLFGLWQTRAGISEGLRWFDILISLESPQDEIRVLALSWAVWMRTLTGDLAGAIHADREAERIARVIGDAAALDPSLCSTRCTTTATSPRCPHSNEQKAKPGWPSENPVTHSGSRRAT